MQPAATRIRRHPERALALPEDADQILKTALVAHVGVIDNGWPVVIPMTFLYEDNCIYLHGAPGSRLIKALASGAPACVEATVVDSLVASKTAESHSINYHSVVCLGRGVLVEDRETQRAVFERMIGRYFEGRAAGVHYNHITEPEFKKTWLVRLTIEGISAKGRSGRPRGAFDDDPDVPGIAGVFPPLGRQSLVG